MEDKILKDNLLFLEEWFCYNPSYHLTLSIDGTYLIYKDDTFQDSINLTQIYLPELLHNEHFRRDILIENTISSKNLFQIIKLFYQTKEIENVMADTTSPCIINVEIKYDVNGKEFILFTDEFQKKYKFTSDTPEKIVNIYNELKRKNNIVTIQDLGKEIKNATIHS